MEIPARDLYDIYVRLARETAQTPPPVGLNAIQRTLNESRYLADLGCRPIVHAAGDCLDMEGLADLPRNTVLTTSRTLYEQGSEEIEGRLRFATYGDSAFETVMDLLRQFECPSCIARIFVQLDDPPSEIVAYLVAARKSNGGFEPRLVTHWNQTEELELAEDERLTPPQIAEAEDQLRRLAHRERSESAAVPRVEQANLDSGHAQLALDYLVADWLFRARRPHAEGDGDNFWALLRDVTDLIESRDRLNAQPLPAGWLRRIRRKTPFQVSAPEIGDDGSVTAPGPLLQSAAEAAIRLANALKIRKSECTTDRVLTRIQNELRQIRSVTTEGAARGAATHDA
jgi:hypothetical protein